MAAKEDFGGPELLSDPAFDAAEITPSDTDDISDNSRGIYVGGGGDITVNMKDGETAVLFKAVPQGVILPIRVSRVLETGTTATDLVALW